MNIDEALIRKQADAMVELGLKESGYRYVNIDDGFFGYWDEKGRLHTHPQRFPNGLKGVAAIFTHSDSRPESIRRPGPIPADRSGMPTSMASG